MAITVPSVAQLADWSGRPEGSYTSFANSALLQATIMFITVTELTPDDIGAMQASQNGGTLHDYDYQLTQQAILSMADYIYLRQPYQQVIASPLTSETIGSYSYGKAQAQVGRNAAALEITGEVTGIVMYDLAVKMLAKRTRAGGVYHSGITIFDGSADLDQTGDTQMLMRVSDGRLVILGPADRDNFDVPFDINAEVFPQDPGF